MKPLVIAAVIGLATGAAASAQTAPAPSAAAPAATTTAPMAKPAAKAGATATTATMPAAGTTTMAAMPAPAPQEFVTKAASGGMFEVESSKLALQHSQSKAVKDFAQMMIDDHTKANDELKTLAGAQGLTVPAKMMGGPADHMKAVEDAKGNAFDPTYIQHQKVAHAETIQLFEAEAAGKDAELAAFARKTLPVLKMHAEHAAMLKP